MDIGIVASRYAKALLKFALLHNETVEVYEGMATLRDSFVKVPKLKATFDDPVLPPATKYRLLCIAAGQTESSCLQRFFKMVLDNRRVGMIQFMAQAYIDAYRKHNNLIQCQLTVPTNLSDSTLAKIKSIVEGKTQKDVEFAVQVDPSILGGFVLEYDARCLDASVAGQLRNIRKQLVK